MTGCGTAGPRDGESFRPGVGSAIIARTLGPVAIDRSSRRLIVSSPAQGAGATSATWGLISHPFIFPLGGDRYSLYYSFIGDEVAGHAGVAAADWPAYTENGGETWKFGDPFIWLDGKPRHATEAVREQAVIHHLGYGWGTVQLGNGARIGYHRDSASGGGDWRTLYGIWTRDGVHVHGPIPVPIRAHTRIDNLYLSPKALELEDGVILALAYGRFHVHEIGLRWWSAAIFESNDGGRSYDFKSFVARPEHSWGDEGANESDMVMLPNGEILCVLRTGAQGGSGFSHPMIIARSADQGRTWTRRRMTLSGVNPRLHLMSDGTLVLGAGRPGSYLVFSRDNGHNWGSKVNLGRSGVQTSGYVDAVEVSPGKLLVVYDMLDFMDTDMHGIRQRINGVYTEFIHVTPR